jgi:hypothetical protein
MRKSSNIRGNRSLLQNVSGRNGHSAENRSRLQPMRLQEEQVNEFKQLLEEEFGCRLSDQEAQTLAHNFAELLFGLVREN